jgi:hypothetical protein
MVKKSNELGKRWKLIFCDMHMTVFQVVFNLFDVMFLRVLLVSFMGESRKWSMPFLQCQFASGAWLRTLLKFSLHAVILYHQSFGSSNFWSAQQSCRLLWWRSAASIYGNQEIISKIKIQNNNRVAYVEMVVQHCFKSDMGTMCESRKPLK